MPINDTYNTIEGTVKNILFKDKNSKFYGYAYPVTSINEVKNKLTLLKKEHHSARHWCYAYQLGTETVTYRANDDGEPNNSAGMPIYGQLQSFNVTNTLIVVVRYFGGVKLGVGGLIHAYKTTAQWTLNEAIIIEKKIMVNYCLIFDYKTMNKVMRIIKENQLTITSQELELNCKMYIAVRKKQALTIFKLFNILFGVEIKKL